MLYLILKFANRVSLARSDGRHHVTFMWFKTKHKVCEELIQFDGGNIVGA